MEQIKIGNIPVGENCPCFIVGEIGINHNGCLETAKKLIDVAQEAGCNAVKFQKRTIDVVYSPEELAQPRENPFGPTNGDLKRGLEFGEAEYREIDRYCKEKGILWFASPWDEESVDFFDNFDLPCLKIASASLSDTNLLKHLRSKGLPLILATGMSSQSQIDCAVDILGIENLIILHSTSIYPSEPEELNLSVISKMKNRYGSFVGYSGHEMGTVASVAAVVLGAVMVERHITLDREMWGSDQSASLEPKELAQLVSDIRMIEIALGDGKKRIFEREIPTLNKLRRVDTLLSGTMNIDREEEDSEEINHEVRLDFRNDSNGNRPAKTL